MTYLDPKRLAKIEQFERLIETRQLEPYHSQLLCEGWSMERVIEAYHDYNYWCYYHQRSKAQRRRHFVEKFKPMLLDNPVNANIYIVRTAVIEGLVIEPDALELQRLQSLWNYLINGIGKDEYFYYVNRYFAILQIYYDKSLKEVHIPSIIKHRHTQLAKQLTDCRNQIARRSLEGYGNQPLQPLWQWLTLFDQEEAEHLAALTDSDYYASDYWREVSQYFRQQHGDRCPYCGAQGPLFLHNPYREYRGQEFFLPQSVTCRCEQCTD